MAVERADGGLHDVHLLARALRGRLVPAAREGLALAAEGVPRARAHGPLLVLREFDPRHRRLCVRAAQSGVRHELLGALGPRTSQSGVCVSESTRGPPLPLFRIILPLPPLSNKSIKYIV